MKPDPSLTDEAEGKIEQLIQALSQSGQTGCGDLVYLPGGLDAPGPLDSPYTELAQELRKQARVWQRVQAMAASMPEETRRAIHQRMHEQGFFLRSEVEAALCP